jgi:hypothetical protein
LHFRNRASLYQSDKWLIKLDKFGFCQNSVILNGVKMTN